MEGSKSEGLRRWKHVVRYLRVPEAGSLAWERGNETALALDLAGAAGDRLCLVQLLEGTEQRRDPLTYDWLLVY
jgi:hypothetical protein